MKTTERKYCVCETPNFDIVKGICKKCNNSIIHLGKKISTKDFSIYNTYIPVTSQEQAKYLKKICLDWNLPIWDDGFNLMICEAYRNFQYDGCDFWIGSKSVSESKKLIEITEEKFIELLKQMKNE